MLVITAAAAFSLSSGVFPRPVGEARLVAFKSLPDANAESCEWEVALPQAPSYAQAGTATAQLPAASSRLAVTSRAPERFIQDPYAAFSSIAVDPMRNEIVVTDENKFRIMVFDRLATTPASATQTEPKRTIGGLNTRSQFASDVYIDPPRATSMSSTTTWCQHDRSSAGMRMGTCRRIGSSR